MQPPCSSLFPPRDIEAQSHAGEVPISVDSVESLGKIASRWSGRHTDALIGYGEAGIRSSAPVEVNVHNTARAPNLTA